MFPLKGKGRDKYNTPPCRDRMTVDFGLRYRQARGTRLGRSVAVKMLPMIIASTAYD
jgi:hypothetical protein